MIQAPNIPDRDSADAGPTTVYVDWASFENTRAGRAALRSRAAQVGAPPRVVRVDERVARVRRNVRDAAEAVLYEALAAGEHRHADHRFEWDRPTFRDWARGVASTHDYRVDFADVGPVHAVHGAPTQAAIFTFGGAPCR